MPVVYAIGDIHGCYSLFKAMVAKIAGDARGVAGGQPPVLILCGDYVDRGEDVASTLEALCALREWAGWNICLLKGNHEEGLLRFLENPAAGAPWLQFGGDATLRSYGIVPPAPTAPPRSWSGARDDLLKRMPASHLHLLLGLDLMVVVGGYAFVHAGVAPGTALAKQSEQDLLWIRDEFLGHRRGFEKTIVHGHSWIDDLPVLEPHRIGLDTGAYETGVLTAVRLGLGRPQVLQVRDPARAAWARSPARTKAAGFLVAQPADYTTGEAPLHVATTNLNGALNLPAPRPMANLNFARAART